jgi:diacylglycerol kinase family enzyme
VAELEGGRRFVLIFAAAASGATTRPLRRLLALPALTGLTRVEMVAGLADALRGLRPGSGEIAVAVGGDGTANLVARALRQHEASPVMGILPLGTGNALAHTLGIGSIERALAALLGGRARTLDVMTTSHPRVTLALASLSCGFDGHFLMRYARRRRLGRPLAAALALPAAIARPRDRIRLVADGADMVAPGEAVFSAGLYNISRFAAGRLVGRGADPGDGRAEAVVCPTGRCYLRTVMGGFDADRDDAAGERRCAHWREATLESSGPIQFDGEWSGRGCYEVRLDPGGLRVLVPPSTG